MARAIVENMNFEALVQDVVPTHPESVLAPETFDEAREKVVVRAGLLLEAAKESVESDPVVYVGGEARSIDPNEYPDLVPLMEVQALRIALQGDLEKLAQSQEGGRARLQAAQLLLGRVTAHENMLKNRADEFAASPAFARDVDELLKRLASNTLDSEKAA